MPIRPSSPSELSNSLINIDNESRNQQQSLYNNLFNVAKLMEAHHEEASRLGTPSQAPVISADKPFFSGFRGYKPVTSIPEDVSGPVSIDQDTANLLSEGKPVYYKPGKAGTVGTEKLAKRLELLPYIATDGKDKDQTTDEIRTLFTEPDDAKALSGITFGNRRVNKQVVISKDISSALKKAGYDVAEGTVVTGDEYNNMLKAADLGFKSERENRLSETTSKDLLIKSVRLELAKLGLKGKQAQAAIDTAVEQALSGKSTSTGTPKINSFAPASIKRIKVKRLADGTSGSILESDFNPDEYEKQ